MDSNLGEHAAINPALVPKITLSSGDKIPMIGLGTFGSDHVSAREVAVAVEEGIQMGYRHFDCAAVYGNERQIGEVFRKAIQEGLKRSEFWVTSKLWNDMHSPANVALACEQSLKDLQIEYLDLYLIHWPFPNSHPPGCDGEIRSPNAKPYIHESYMKTWKAMERLHEEGLVRNIGTSNMTIPKLDLLLRDANIKPVCNQMELHPYFQQPEFFEWLVTRKIQPIGYSPLGSPGRPERDKTEDDPVVLHDLVLREIAEESGIHPASLCIKWAAQRGQIPIPFSTNPKHMESNIKAVTTAPLTPEQMSRIESIDQRHRLIKGQVFLWKEGQTWEALWDHDGKITPP